MKREDAELIGLLAQFIAAKFAKAMLLLSEDESEDTVGQKTDEAVAALDAAIDKVKEFQAAEDERDASVILERVSALQGVLAPAPGQPVDTLTGTPVTRQDTVGPTPTVVN